MRGEERRGERRKIRERKTESGGEKQRDRGIERREVADREGGNGDREGER